jgi:hypothetical protein
MLISICFDFDNFDIKLMTENFIKIFPNEIVMDIIYIF